MARRIAEALIEDEVLSRAAVTKTPHLMPALAKLQIFSSASGCVCALSMPHVRGGTLRDYVSQSHRPLEVSLVLLSELCQGLANLSELMMDMDKIDMRSHNDVKPANAMIHIEGSKRSLVLTDFGMVGKTGRAGTYAYMAPERQCGEAGDVFSVGMTIIEVMCVD